MCILMCYRFIWRWGITYESVATAQILQAEKRDKTQNSSFIVLEFTYTNRNLSFVVHQKVALHASATRKVSFKSSVDILIAS